MKDLSQIIQEYMETEINDSEMRNLEQLVLNCMNKIALEGLTLYSVWYSIQDDDEEWSELVLAVNEEAAEEQVIKSLMPETRNRLLTYGANRVK